MILYRWVLILSLFLSFRTFAQYDCPDSLIYLVRPSGSQSLILSWNPFSNAYVDSGFTNQSITDSGVIGGFAGLALLPNISGGTVNPTFYITQYNTLYYWSGLNWVSTGVSLTNTSVNEIGGCGNSIYGICGPVSGQYQVRKFTPPNTVTTVLTSSTQIGGDIVCDCNCNFYLLFNNSLKKYDPNGNLLTTYTISGLPILTTVVTRFGIIGNKIYIINAGSPQATTILYKAQGTIIGNTLFTNTISIYSNNSNGPAFAVCPFSISQSISGTISSNTLGCSPTNCTLGVNTGTNQINYYWSGSGLITPIGNGSVVSVNSTGTYTCFIKEGFCKDTLLSMVTTVNANTTLVVPIITPSNTLCYEINTNLFASPNGTQYAYAWSGSSLNVTVSTSSLIVPGAGTYTIQITDNTNGCSGAAIAKVLQSPLLDFKISSSTLCVYSVEGKDKAILSLNGATNYTLLTSPGFSVQFVPSQPIVLLQNSASSINGSVGSATLYGTNGVCTTSATTNFSVLPVTTIAVVPTQTTVCNGATIEMVATGVNSYTWSSSSEFISIENNKALGKIVSKSEFNVVGLDNYGCLTPIYTITADVFPNLEGKLLYNRLICEGMCETIKFVPFIDSSNKVFSNWNMNNTDNYSTSEFLACFPAAGIYTLTGFLLDSLRKCTNLINFDINVFEKPKPKFEYEPKLPKEGLDEVRFVNTTEGLSQNKWTWYFDQNKTMKFDGQETSYLFSNVGNYAVALVVQNSFGCSDTLVRVIVVQEDFNFNMPNSFTPNSDQRNDFFFPIVRGVKFIEFSIYDRWGQRLFFTNEVGTGWDGFFKGNACKQDTYTWLVKLSTKSGIEKVYKGFVLLMR